MKSRHIFNALLFGLGFILLGWFVIFYGDWFIPSPWLKYAVLLLSLPISAFLSFRIIPNSAAAIGNFALPNTFIVKIGRILFYMVFLWLLLAQSIPAAITNIFGSTQSVHETVNHFSRSSATCGQRLILSKTNPPFGGYCRAGAPKSFHRGDTIVVTYKVTFLGSSVISFHPAKG